MQNKESTPEQAKTNHNATDSVLSFLNLVRPKANFKWIAGLIVAPFIVGIVIRLSPLYPLTIGGNALVGASGVVVWLFAAVLLVIWVVKKILGGG